MRLVSEENRETDSPERAEAARDGRVVRQQLQDVAVAGDQVKIQVFRFRDTIDREKRRAYLGEHRLTRRVLEALTWGSPFLGFLVQGWIGVVVGLGVAGLTRFLGPWLDSLFRRLGNSAS